MRREPVPLKPEEDNWLRLEWGLRSCETWKDGYSMYRCTAANRSSTKQTLLDDLIKFWGYHDEDELPEKDNIRSTRYKYVFEDGTETEEEFTAKHAERNVKALRLVQDAFKRGRANKLNRRYNYPEQFFEALVAIDAMTILCIDTMAEANDPRYRVYCKDQCLLTNNMETVTCLLRGSRQHGIKIRGVAEQNKHFCSLYPMDEQPNFAGAKAIGQFT